MVPRPSPVPSPAPSGPPVGSPSAAPSGPPLGTVPSVATLLVTGNPADGDFLATEILAALDRAIRPTLQAGAVVRYGAIAPLPQALAAGFETTYTVPVTIAGAAGVPPLEATASVTVANQGLAGFDPVVLALDDDPEYIHGEGVLFRVTTDAARPLRVYYYHENVAAARRLFVVLGAQSDTRVQIVHAPGGPSIDVMSVGHSVSRAFVVAQPANEGIVVDVVAGIPFVLRDAAIQPGDGIAGAVDIRVLVGGPVTATVLALAPGADPTAFVSAPKLPDDGHNRHGTFALGAAGERTVAFTIGGPDASVEYGERSHGPQNVDPADPGRDAGDYGVLQRIAFDVDNPGAAPATIYLYEQPVGGVVRNSFLVNGALVDVGCARLSQHYQIAAAQVAARSTTTLHVVSMADGGSNYPLEVGVTTTPPLPTTPPLGAPDGCFPKPGATPAPAPAGTGPPPSPSAAPVPAPT